MTNSLSMKIYRDPASLCNSIKEHYASTSAEKIATHFAKLFSIKFPYSFTGLSEAISSFCSTLKLLCSLSPQLFSANIMPQVLAFYILRILPETCRHVSTAVFHFIKVSTKIPTIQKVSKEVELDIIQRADMDEEENISLKLASKPKRQLCSKGKHNPLAPHPESKCFQLFAEKSDAYHRRQNNQEFGVALAVCNLTSGLPVLDSGTSNTIAPGQSSFMKTWPTSEQLQAANGSDMRVEAKGVLHVKTCKGDLIVKDALLVPSATLTLVAMGPFLQKGAVLRGYPGGADLFDKDGRLILETKLVNNILVINSIPSNSINSISSSNPLLIHQQLGHPGNDLASIMVPGVDFSLLDCTSCSLSKAHRLPFQGKFPDALFPLGVIHMDVCGPIIPATPAGNRYIFQIIDGFSRMRFTFPLERKSDCLESFISFKRLVENQTGKKIRAVVTDNGGKFVNSKFTDLFKRFSIDHLLTAPFTPQQNPIAERGNRTLLEKIRVLLADYQVLTDWWGEACSMATYLLKRTPVSTIGFKAPICKWKYLTSLQLDHLHQFGCTAVMHIPKAKRVSKVDPIGSLCMFLGVLEHHHNFCLFDLKSRRIVITHDCTFKDGEAFWPTDSSVSAHSPHLSFPDYHLCSSNPTVEPVSGFSDVAAIPTIINKEEPIAVTAEEHPQALSSECSLINELAGDPVPSSGTTLPKGWVYDDVPCKAPQNISGAVSPKNIIKEGCVRRPPACFVGAFLNEAPRNVSKAMASSKVTNWLTAIGKEFESLERHQVIKEVSLTNDMRLLDTTWVFREKTDAQGNLIEEKARLCVRDFLQVENIDFHETFAPTGWLATLKFLLGYCASHDLDIQQMDVKTALFHGDLDEEIYILISDEYSPTLQGKVCLRLKGSLYGLRQSLRNCVEGDPSFVFLHVDDLVIGGRNLAAFKAQIKASFDMKDLGDIETVTTPQVPSSRLAPTSTTAASINY
ncbi:hypothetical protein O181_019311 [Austropuccinia psidii MF-1]|uniref:Integrase catalytic domain-containing protein n=1 Tax=Austropuccinia psidii MF-1 TaxID=1389203 RepID=A0A9Q3C6X2_9BASI|nr:hypothetical protein [Austropuccinia psidii MF-1]